MSVQSYRDGNERLVRTNWWRWLEQQLPVVVKQAPVQNKIGSYSVNQDRRGNVEEGTGTGHLR